MASIGGREFEELGRNMPTSIFGPIVLIATVTAPLAAISLYVSMTVLKHPSDMSLFLFVVFIAAHGVLRRTI